MKMRENVMRLYRAGMLTAAGLARAVRFGWITGEQYEELTGEEYHED